MRADNAQAATDAGDNEMIVKMKREGRTITNSATGKEEEILTTHINGKRIMRGQCADYFQRVTGIKVPPGSEVVLGVRVIVGAHDHPAHEIDDDVMNKYPVTEADDLYDQSFLTDRQCPECGARTVSHPDCTETCSNRKCKSYNIWIDYDEAGNKPSTGKRGAGT